MKLVMTLPAAMEADSDFDKKEQCLTITPKFYRGIVNAPIARVVVEGDKGTKRQFVIGVSGTTGNIVVQEAEKTVKPRFDGVTADEFGRERAKKTAQMATRRDKKTPPSADAKTVAANA
jgi:hypothetical protein